MSNKNYDDVELTLPMRDFIRELLDKARKSYDITNTHKNCALEINGLTVPIRVDDLQLLFLGCVLLPNIINYLVNILPQFLYPYIVAYLQDLSEMRDDPVTINELYNYLTENNDGNIFDCAPCESQTK